MWRLKQLNDGEWKRLRKKINSVEKCGVVKAFNNVYFFIDENMFEHEMLIFNELLKMH